MILAVNRFEHARSMARIDAEVDRKRWLMPPQARMIAQRRSHYFRTIYVAARTP